MNEYREYQNDFSSRIISKELFDNIGDGTHWLSEYDGYQTRYYQVYNGMNINYREEIGEFDFFRGLLVVACLTVNITYSTDIYTDHFDSSVGSMQEIAEYANGRRFFVTRKDMKKIDDLPYFRQVEETVEEPAETTTEEPTEMTTEEPAEVANVAEVTEVAEVAEQETAVESQSEVAEESVAEEPEAVEEPVVVEEPPVTTEIHERQSEDASTLSAFDKLKHTKDCIMKAAASLGVANEISNVLG